MNDAFELYREAYASRPQKKSRARRQPGRDYNEGELQRAVLKLLKYDRRVVFFERQNSGGPKLFEKDGKKYYIHRPAPGTPDVYVQLYEGRCVWIELKAPGEKPTELQQAFMRRVRASGGRADVAWSLEHVEVILSGGVVWDD